MSEITVIGLGLMGSAIALAFLDAGHKITVWNRTTDKMVPLVAAGAKGASNANAAVSASPVVLICIDSYPSTCSLLGEKNMTSSLAGRTFVQLTNGSPDECRNLEAWLKSQGAVLLDGAILGGPQAIGRPELMLLYAGPEKEYLRCEPMLRALGGKTRHVGEEIGTAEALDLAWLSMLLGLYVGVAHGARVCEAEGVSGHLQTSVYPNVPYASWLADIIDKSSYANPGAKLTTWRTALAVLTREASERGITSEIPDFIAGIMDRAINSGYGNDHIASVVKVLKP